MVVYGQIHTPGNTPSFAEWVRFNSIEDAGKYFYAKFSLLASRRHLIDVVEMWLFKDPPIYTEGFPFRILRFNGRFTIVEDKID